MLAIHACHTSDFMKSSELLTLWTVAARSDMPRNRGNQTRRTHGWRRVCRRHFKAAPKIDRL